ncbi:hypothetical protein J2X67_005408 [Variovorax sp. 3319]|nr:hypothetical protein [Variovorax sp. 3319]
MRRGATLLFQVATLHCAYANVGITLQKNTGKKLR